MRDHGQQIGARGKLIARLIPGGSEGVFRASLRSYVLRYPEEAVHAPVRRVIIMNGNAGYCDVHQPAIDIAENRFEREFVFRHDGRGDRRGSLLTPLFDDEVHQFG